MKTLETHRLSLDSGVARPKAELELRNRIRIIVDEAKQLATETTAEDAAVLLVTRHRLTVQDRLILVELLCRVQYNLWVSYHKLQKLTARNVDQELQMQTGKQLGDKLIEVSHKLKLLAMNTSYQVTAFKSNGDEVHTALVGGIEDAIETAFKMAKDGEEETDEYGYPFDEVFIAEVFTDSSEIRPVYELDLNTLGYVGV